MTQRERALRGGAVSARKARERAARLRWLVEQGLHPKTAAWAAGIPDRTARRYMAERIGR